MATKVKGKTEEAEPVVASKPAKVRAAAAKKAVEEGEEAKPKRGGAHPKHPACPTCGKAMYKSMEKGKAVKKTDPWAFCRNEACEQHGVDQGSIEEASVEEGASEVEEEAPEEVVEAEEEVEEEVKPKKASSKAKPKANGTSVSVPDRHADKSEVFKKQYARITKKLAQAVNGDEAAKNVIGLCMTVIKAEEGDDIANEVVDELELESIGIARSGSDD